MDPLELAIIIPAYNEEKTIGKVINDVKKATNLFGLSYEIIVVNDGSNDKTRMEVEKTKANLINLKYNMGKGFALRTGFNASKGLNILTVDADGSHMNADINHLLNEFFKSDVDMLIGSRFLYRPIKRFTSPINIVGNKIFKYLLFLLSGEIITDTQSGLRIFKRNLLDSINCNAKGYEIEAELTAESVSMGFKVKEIPISCKQRFYGVSHLNSILDGTIITKTLIKSYYFGRRRRTQITNLKI